MDQQRRHLPKMSLAPPPAPLPGARWRRQADEQSVAPPAEPSLAELGASSVGGRRWRRGAATVLLLVARVLLLVVIVLKDCQETR